MKNNNVDWFNELKLDIINLVLLFKEIKEDVILMLVTNAWILEDINLFESFEHLKEMIDVSNNDLDNFVERVGLLEDDSNMFNVTDLKDEFDFIKENIKLEVSFITNMVGYMDIVDNFTLDETAIMERLEIYLDVDTACYNQMKINNEQLKQLRKERRD